MASPALGTMNPAGSMKPASTGERFSVARLLGLRRGVADDIAPGQYFKQRDDSVWEVVRMVNFQIHPIPHVELVKIHPVKSEGTTNRKIISVDALRDRRLYRPEPAGAWSVS
jgi:hypothetical protein